MTHRHGQQCSDSQIESGVWGGESGQREINRAERDLTLGGECMMCYADDVLLSCTLETCMLCKLLSPQ